MQPLVLSSQEQREHCQHRQPCSPVQTSLSLECLMCACMRLRTHTLRHCQHTVGPSTFESRGVNSTLAQVVANPTRVTKSARDCTMRTSWGRGTLELPSPKFSGNREVLATIPPTFVSAKAPDQLLHFKPNCQYATGLVCLNALAILGVYARSAFATLSFKYVFLSIYNCQSSKK